LLRGKTLVEFVARDIRLAIQAHYELGFKPRQVTYGVSFAAAPLVKCDYMQWNQMFNACLAYDQAPKGDRTKAESQIADLSAAFTFGDELRLREVGQGAIPTEWTFDPRPLDAAADDGAAADDLSNRFAFARLPTKAGVPYVQVSGDITCEAFARSPDAGADDPLLIASTDFWPVDDQEIASLASQITAGCCTPREKLAAILAWLLPGKNIRYAGDFSGSRWGVSQVLKQGFGHCWDFSDVFITLCRASGVPARQVGGWLVGQSGHVWAEALTDEDGWEAFDPTAGMGCGSDYVPIITTADGRWPLAYVSAMEINAIEGK
jgi:transglutaminase-like putative cysteine protease